jgi:hypothetical protein
MYVLKLITRRRQRDRSREDQFSTVLEFCLGGLSGPLQREIH